LIAIRARWIGEERKAAAPNFALIDLWRREQDELADQENSLTLGCHVGKDEHMSGPDGESIETASLTSYEIFPCG